jgi:hypothetical protein
MSVAVISSAPRFMSLISEKRVFDADEALTREMGFRFD